MKKLLLIGVLSLSCFAADSDLDGVSNKLDICPNTPFLSIVNKDGCSKSQEKAKDSLIYNISAGFEYDRIKDSKDGKTFFSSFSMRNTNYKFSIYYSKYKNGYSENYRSSDLILSLFYNNYTFPNTVLTFGLKSYLPTQENDKTDYSFYVQESYQTGNISFNISENHETYGETYLKDTDTITVEIGTKYKEFYITPYYYTESSPYDHSIWDKYAGVNVYHLLRKNVGLSLDLSTNINETSNYSVVSSIDYTF